MENAMNEEKIQDLNRRNGISHHKKRLHRNARSGNGANGNGDEYLEEDGLVEGIQKETMSERKTTRNLEIVSRNESLIFSSLLNLEAKMPCRKTLCDTIL